MSGYLKNFRSAQYSQCLSYSVSRLDRLLVLGSVETHSSAPPLACLGGFCYNSVMFIKRPWAFWRRVQYGGGFSLVLILLLVYVYQSYIYTAASCFDGRQNGTEVGDDCGGGCARICLADVQAPVVKWAKSFKVTDGQYNAVGYVENMNLEAGTAEIGYKFLLYDSEGLIAESAGTTYLPPDGEYPIFAGRINTGSRIPTKTFLELEEAPVWQTVYGGRDLFTVTKRELLGVDDRPRLNATIENNSLAELKNAEVVATIFNSQGTALTASRTSIDSLAGETDSDVVFTWPLPIAKTIRSCEVPTDVVIAIDLSGSMNSDSLEPPEPLTSVIKAANDFVTRLQSADQAALITFATTASVDSQLKSAGTVAALIANLAIDPAEETGSTNTGEAFTKAEEVFSASFHNTNARKVMVILTDGKATAPDEDPEGYAIRKATQLKSSDVEVFAIGLGESVNMDFIREIASENDAFQALSADEVDQIYRDITESICEDGPAVIDIVTKTKSHFTPIR
ncbi:hypothetical protein CL653_01210 [bacterium]|nr:hypothetical protein [bacterium]